LVFGFLPPVGVERPENRQFTPTGWVTKVANQFWDRHIPKWLLNRAEYSAIMILQSSLKSTL
jgi:hypothetical protein